MNTIDQALEAVVERVVRAELACRTCAPCREARDHGDVRARARDLVSTVRAMIRDERLPVVKIGRAVRVHRDAQIGEPAPVRTCQRLELVGSWG